MAFQAAVPIVMQIISMLMNSRKQPGQPPEAQTYQPQQGLFSQTQQPQQNSLMGGGEWWNQDTGDDLSKMIASRRMGRRY